MTPREKIGGVRLSLALGLLVFCADRLHKYIQIEQLGWRGGEFVPVTSFFDYVLVWNTGISYGLLGDVPVWGLLVVMVLAMALLTFWWVRADNVLVRCGLALSLGGAASHIIDRWIYQAVPDFFHFHWDAYSFYVFNISDSAITLGVVLLALDAIGLGKKQSQKQSDDPNDA